VKPRKTYWPATSAEVEVRRISSCPGLRRPGRVLLPASLALVFLLSGCGGPYLFQQGLGQLDISLNRVELNDTNLLDSLDASQRGKLSWIPLIIKFAENELGLEPGDSYTSYFDTQGGPVSLRSKR